VLVINNFPEVAGLVHSLCLVATDNRLDNPGLNPGGDEMFRTRSDRPQGPHFLLYDEFWFSFPEVRWPGIGVDHLPPSSAVLVNG